jgi:CRP/FNR family cyclic AMP-dependent transcriptional regulator
MDEQRIDLLRRVPLFSDLERRDLRELANSMKERTFPAGHKLAEEGQGGVGFFVIENGEATVTIGGEEVGRIGPGDYFGEIALIAETPRTATVTADSEIRALGLASWEFRPLVESNASVAWKLLEALAKKLRDAEHRHGGS